VKAPTFDGDITKSHDYLNRCRQLFFGDPLYDGEDRASHLRRIHAIGKTLAGVAFNWFVRRSNITGYWNGSWPAFHADFISRFGDASRRSAAIRKLHNITTELKQKPTDDVQTHVGRFEDLLMEAEQNDMPDIDRIALLHSTLEPIIRGLVRISHFTNYDTFVDHLCATAQEDSYQSQKNRASAAASARGRLFFEINRARQQRQQQAQQRQGGPSSGGQALRAYTQPQGGGAGRPRAPRPGPPGLAPPGSLSHQTPDMSRIPKEFQGDLDTVKGLLSSLMQANRCFKCRQVGHMQTQCPYGQIVSPAIRMLDEYIRLYEHNQSFEQPPPADGEVGEDPAAPFPDDVLEWLAEEMGVFPEAPTAYGDPQDPYSAFP
jgi:hypothetical protein